jgi:hypothetical protein
MSLGRWKQWAYEKAGSVQGTQLESDFADLGRVCNTRSILRRKTKCLWDRAVPLTQRLALQRTDTISDVVKNLTAATEVLLQPSSSMK